MSMCGELISSKREVYLRTRVIVAISFVICLSTAFLMRVNAASAVEEHKSAEVLELKLDGEVEPILATYMDEGLAEAAQRHAALVLITMDTPGGLSDSMKDIIQHILASPVPVAVYVSPTGARGASAGFYILLSADIAAMAPGTHAGAASPVIMIGGYAQQIDSTFQKKINNDAMAFLRSFTEVRGRNPAVAETAITEAKAFTEKEMLDQKMIDLVAGSREDLLRQLNGRAIKRFDGSKLTLALDSPVLVPFELSARQKFLARIVAPDAFFILLVVGVLGLYTEFTHPGVIAPGVFGGICMVLALYAMHLLPVNFAGVFLILLALAFFILEAKYTSHGVLAGGGILSMLLGRHVPDSLAAYQWRRQFGNRRSRHAALRAAHCFPDAPGVAFAKMEIGDRPGRIDRSPGRRRFGVARRRGRHDSYSRGIVGRGVFATSA